MNSDNPSSIASPFVYDLYTRVIQSHKSYYAFDAIEAIRAMLEKNTNKVKTVELGAGSHTSKTHERSIAEIAKNVAKSKKIGELLFSLTNCFQPSTGLELGTSLGISALYQYSGSKATKWFTIEGCAETAHFAKKVFSSFKAQEIQVIVGNFNTELPVFINNTPKLDYVFFDGNHKKQATIDYFELCLKSSHCETVFVFDDIHWSKEMEEAWEYIKNHPKVTVTIDLFWVGLVFFKKEENKQHFILKF